ncbi:holin [Streptomyces sp. NPDC004732]|uniref:holin n=1 Tax=Streptomyces sp. NPDC004732 TaxID=3154290 RepID=UPI0033A1CE64
MWTAAFWKATTERAIRTFAQALAAVLVAGATSLLDVEWGAAFATAGLAAVLAVLTAIGTSEVGAAGPGITEQPTTKAKKPKTPKKPKTAGEPAV